MAAAWQQDEDARAAAEAYLAHIAEQERGRGLAETQSKERAIAADLAFPVDLAWLVVIGGRYDDKHPFAVVFDIPMKIVTTPCLLVCSDYANAADCPWDIVNIHYDDSSDMAMIAEELATRGEVLDLLTALKIEPKGA